MKFDENFVEGQYATIVFCEVVAVLYFGNTYRRVKFEGCYGSRADNMIYSVQKVNLVLYDHVMKFDENFVEGQYATIVFCELLLYCFGTHTEEQDLRGAMVQGQTIWFTVFKGQFGSLWQYRLEQVDCHSILTFFAN